MTSPSTSSSVTSADTAFAGDAAPSFHRRLVLDALTGMPRGSLRLELPGGEVVVTGDPVTAARARLPLDLPATAMIRVRRERFFRRCLLAGDIGFAESYIDGDWETPDVAAVVAWFLHNIDDAPTLSGSRRRLWRAGALNLLRFANRLEHLLQPNSRETARSNIARHYDLSNDFFALFLDPSMMYSSARYTETARTLADAQREKNDALCRSLRLKPTDRVLEIGSGWGGWAIHAASTYGCHVTSLTISRQQYELARRRIAEAGLTERIDLRLQDYRDLEGRFDKIVSIEMMEALGHAYLPSFCAALARVLKEDGLIALQFITCPDARYRAFRRGVDFIQKHIFPGSLLLSLNRVNEQLSHAGRFVLNRVEDFGPDYARTLRAWRENFEARLGEVRALGFDEAFLRKWGYYLSYCEAAFAMRNISVVQTLHTRPNNLAL